MTAGRVDLVVAGGGPAGLATALHARRAGMSVVVREPRAGVVDKACGEGLMPGALAALRDLGVDPDGHRLDGIRYRNGETSATADFPSGPGRGVRRTTLHRAMREAALDAGVRIEQAGVRAVVPVPDGVRVDDTDAAYLVAADGLHSPLRRALGLDGPPARLRRFGLRRHVRMAPWTSYVEVHWSARGEAYVTPVAPDLVGVAVLTSAPTGLDDLLTSFPELSALIADRPVAGPDRGAGPLRQRVTRRVRGRVLLVGDASGYVDALTGEGIALALREAEAAVAAMVAGRPSRYDRDWRVVTRRYRLLTTGLVHATRVGPVRRALVPAAERLPRVFSAAVSALSEPA